MAVREEERSLLERITEPEDNRDKDDAIVDSWMKRVARGYVVRFVDMFAEDVAAREGPPPQTGGNGIEANESAENSVQLKDILEAVKKFREDVGERMDRIENKVGEVDLRLAVSEAYIHEQIALGKRSNQERPDKEVGCNKRSKKK